MLKPAVTTALNALLASVRAEFEASQDWQDIEKLAYPPPAAAEKKKKVKKDKGSKYPGGAVGEVIGVAESAEDNVVHSGKAGDGQAGA